MQNKTVNGWANYSTWLFNVWFEPQTVSDVEGGKEMLEAAQDSLPDYAKDFMDISSIDWDELLDHVKEEEEEN